ncbi:hypothetical protein [Brevibacillus reuszeri]|uniref:hypothetical protein n=1 Tax=Brevibacillus reuszeri TaxID=54915 RepID=UPI0013DF240D|nr:hypothetical protein [Brevibacillus reuszeri]
MVGKHFNQVEVKMLCALIDQRMEKSLPSSDLRMSLIQEIQKIQKSMGYLNDQQKKAKQRIRRDINQYPDSKEDAIIFCKHIDGTEFSISISDNYILWNSDGMTINLSFKYNTKIIGNKYIRAIVPKFSSEFYAGSYTVQTAVFEEIYFNDIAECSDFYLLEALFTVSEQEKKTLGTKICIECGQRSAVPDFNSKGHVIGNLEKPRESRKVVEYQCQNCSTIFYK